MIPISVEEKEYVLSKLPNAHIRRTVRQKSKRHKYWMEEWSTAVAVLNEYRENKGVGNE